MKHSLPFLCLALLAFGSNVAAYEDQRVGLSELAIEIETLIDLTYAIESAPKSPGRFEVNFQSIRNELNLIRRGVIDASKNPISIQQKLETIQPVITGDYLE